MNTVLAFLTVGYLIQYLRYFNKLTRRGGSVRLKFEASHSVLVLGEALLLPLIWPIYSKEYTSKCIGEDCSGCKNVLFR